MVTMIVVVSWGFIRVQGEFFLLRVRVAVSFMCVSMTAVPVIMAMIIMCVCASIFMGMDATVFSFCVAIGGATHEVKGGEEKDGEYLFHNDKSHLCREMK